MRARAGFTLIELVVSLLLLMVITGAAVNLLRKQTAMVSRETSRMDALQNAQFAASQIDRELREAGAGVVDYQPMLVQIDAEAMTFNANMVSIDTGDVRAVYRMSDADTNGARGMRKSERTPLPNSISPVVSYPDTTYMAAAGVPSGAETISYFLRPDSTTTPTNDYLLFRRLNAQVPTLIARGIVKDSRDTTPFFTYYTTDTLSRLKAIAQTRLPLYHGRIHGAVDDTAQFALPDSVRAVRVHFLTAAKDPRTGEDALRTVNILVRLMNAGLLTRSSCGQPPYPSGVPVVVSSVAAATPKTMTVTWPKSLDDGGGEKDIERYAIFRKLSTATSFGDPISSIPASLSAAYTFTDVGVLAGQSYVYGIAAQDCTPLLSGVTASGAVTVIP